MISSFSMCALSVSLRKINPIVPAINEAIRIAIFELLTTLSLANARSVMKIDMVKPIPPKNPAPIMFFHFKSDGITQSPKPTPINEKRKIPKGFPIVRPAMIPRLFVCSKPLCHVSPMAIHVFATANKGRIKNATGLCRKC